jgi:hypothetical protein
MTTMPRISNPCHEDWSKMTPDDRGRHCAACAKTVVDVTAMPYAAAQAYLAGLNQRQGERSHEHVCVRAFSDGRGRLTGTRHRLLTNALAAMLAMTVAGCGGGSPGDRTEDQRQASEKTERASKVDLADIRIDVEIEDLTIGSSALPEFDLENRPMGREETDVLMGQVAAPPLRIMGLMAPAEPATIPPTPQPPTLESANG